MTGAARGRFITLEGGEGAGKSVQAKRLEDEACGARARSRADARAGRLAARRGTARGRSSAASPPSSGPTGEALLFAAARIDHLDKTIVPALERGAWVVCDRFANSTRAYQGVAGKLARGLHRPPGTESPSDANRPDLTLVLDIPAEGGPRAGARAARARGRRIASRPKALEFHETLRRAFLDIAAAEPERCVVIDALKPEEEVADAIWSAVEARLDPAQRGEARVMRKRAEDEELPESDALAGAPHPRHAQTPDRPPGRRSGDARAPIASGRLAHAWLIGGPKGVGKATLAWRFARFVLANPDPAAASGAGGARPRGRPEDPGGASSRGARPSGFRADPARLAAGQEEVFERDPGRATCARRCRCSSMSAAFGGWRVCIVDCAEDLNRIERQRASEDDRGAAAALADPDRLAPAGAGAADDPLALPPDPSSIRCPRTRSSRRSRALGPPWSEADPAAVAGRRGARQRLGARGARPPVAGIGGGRRADRFDHRPSAAPRPARGAQARRRARRPGRGGEAYDAFHRELYDWLAAYAARTRVLGANGPKSSAALWDRIRAAARDTEAMNLDRRLHVLAIFAEIAATDRVRR